MYAQLTKARLSALVLVTAAVGYLAGNPEGVNWLDAAWTSGGAAFRGEWDYAARVIGLAAGSVNWLLFVLTLAGVGLAAAGTSALNQWIELDRDRAMQRTSERPLPSGSMSRREALLAGGVMVSVGSGVVFFGVNPLAGFLTLLTATIYNLIYTPLKAKSSLNTLIGAVCGAVPPMIGWAAAAENLALGAWLLGGVLFVWQLPHFLALAWLYRDDYTRGGFRMLPVHDAGGELTGRIVLLMSLLLVPLSLMLVIFGLGGLIYAAIAVALGAGFAFTAVRMYRRPTAARARAVFLASILYLPLLLGVMVLDQPRPNIRAVLFGRQLAQADDGAGTSSEDQRIVSRDDDAR